ncbi:MAG TPA: serine hydrolase domain-containing protein, partial [Kineosporiaceae bacterium]|nr:serine hydrolase domain-containing protein [Kineosporiaceae bacterium]
NYTDQAFMEAVVADPARAWAPEEIVAIATKHQPTFAPGTGWAYSNTNYIVVGMILRKVTGTSPADLVQQRIARPLGLHRTYLPTLTARHTGPGYAHGYLATPDATTFQYTDVSGWAIGGWAGTAGAMISTPRELSRFFSALLGGKLLPAAQLTQMRTLVPFPAGSGATGGYGLGLQRVDTPCGTAWGHGGGTLGHRSTVLFSADGRRAIVTDMTTSLDPRATPNAAVDKATAAATAADLTAICQMFGKPVPTTPATTN